MKFHLFSFCSGKIVFSQKTENFGRLCSILKPSLAKFPFLVVLQPTRWPRQINWTTKNAKTFWRRENALSYFVQIYFLQIYFHWNQTILFSNLIRHCTLPHTRALVYTLIGDLLHVYDCSQSILARLQHSCSFLVSFWTFI